MVWANERDGNKAGSVVSISMGALNGTTSANYASEGAKPPNRRVLTKRTKRSYGVACTSNAVVYAEANAKVWRIPMVGEGRRIPMVGEGNANVTPAHITSNGRLSHSWV